MSLFKSTRYITGQCDVNLFACDTVKSHTIVVTVFCKWALEHLSHYAVTKHCNDTCTIHRIGKSHAGKIRWNYRNNIVQIKIPTTGWDNTAAGSEAS